MVQFPTPEVLAGAGKQQWEKFLHVHKLWRPKTVAKRFEVFAHAADWKRNAAVTRAKSRLAVSLAKMLQTLERQLDEYRQVIEARFAEHPDHDLFGSLLGDSVAHCDDSTAGDYVNSLTFTELCSGWTENRAVWNKAGHAVLAQVRELETAVPFRMVSFHSDNGGEFLNWPWYEYLTGRRARVPFTRSRAYRKNDHAHCEQKNWTHVRQLLGYARFGHPELVEPLKALYRTWGLYHNHFRPTFKRAKREKKNGKTVKTYEKNPQTPYQRLLARPDVSKATQAKLRAVHAQLDPFALKKEIERRLQNFFTLIGNLNREATKP